jgi:hypothetical protein
MGKSRRTERGLSAMIARFATHRLALEVVKVRLGANQNRHQGKYADENPAYLQFRVHLKLAILFSTFEELIQTLLG